MGDNPRRKGIFSVSIASADAVRRAFARGRLA
jgi:hypothetical protein